MLARASLEMSVTARCVTDSSIAPEARRDRAVILVLHDHRNRRAFESAPPFTIPRPTEGKTGDERYDDYRQVVRDLGLMGQDWRGEEQDPEPMPVVDRFGRYADAPWLHRLLSAFTHGLEWSLLWSDRGATTDASGVPGVRRGRVSALDSLSAYVAMHTVQTLETALADFAFSDPCARRRSESRPQPVGPAARRD